MTFARLPALFSVNTFIAAMLALWIGFSLDLPRPYWAMLTVYITANPQTGALRSKAVFRVIGTTLGAAAAIAITPNLIHSPLLLCAVMALWIGFCLYLSLLDRTPRSYIFMLAGYTTAIIGFPSVNAPGEIFETALARVEEISLGIVCAALVHSLSFPRDTAQALHDRASGFLADARRWIAEALSGRHGRREEQDRRRLAADVTDLHLLSTHLPYDTASFRPSLNGVRALQSRMGVILPLVTGVEDRLAALKALQAPEGELNALIRDVIVWCERSAVAGDAAGADLIVRARALAASAAVVTPVTAQALMTISAATRVAQLVAAVSDSQALSVYLQTPGAKAPESVQPVLQAAAPLKLHLDHGLALLSALALAAALLGCCAIWIGFGWRDGAAAAMSAAIFSSFFAAQDDPAPAQRNFLKWTLLSTPIPAVYLFAVLPAIDGFPLLILVLAPCFLLLGYLQATPKYTGIAMPMVLGTAGALALQETFSADLPAFVNGTLAQVIGIAAALTCTRLMRSFSAEWSVTRILRQGWRDLAALARAPQSAERLSWTSLMLDRVGLIRPRLATFGSEPPPHDALADMRVGLNLLDLRDLLSLADPQPIERVLSGVAAAFEQKARGEAAGPSADLLTGIDQAIDAVDQIAAPEARQRGFTALAGLRRTLFPAAAPYHGALA